MNADAPTVLVELLPDHPAYDDPGRARLAPAHAGDAGIDLVACESVRLAPGERAAVSAGLRIALPPGVEAQVRPRSGRALREGLTVVNAPGTIDPGYRGPVTTLLLNAAAALDPDDLAGDPSALGARLRAGLEARTIHVQRGERVAQLVFAPVATARGEAGFGSTGGG